MIFENIIAARDSSKPMVGPINSFSFASHDSRKKFILKVKNKVKSIHDIFKEMEVYATVKEALSCYPKLESGQESSIPNHIVMTHSEEMLHKMSFVSDGGDRTEIPVQIRPNSAMSENK